MDIVLTRPKGPGTREQKGNRSGDANRLLAAIEQKMTAQQQAQQMDFTLEKERKEAQRKAIEAQGIQDFQNIVTKGITEQLRS